MWVFLCHRGSRWDLFCCCRDQKISNSDPQQVISLQSGMSAAEDNVIFLSIGCDLLVVFGKEFNLTHNALISKLQHAKHLVSYFIQFNRLKQPRSAGFWHNQAVPRNQITLSSPGPTRDTAQHSQSTHACYRCFSAVLITPSHLWAWASPLHGHNSSFIHLLFNGDLGCLEFYYE